MHYQNKKILLQYTNFKFRDFAKINKGKLTKPILRQVDQDLRNYENINILSVILQFLL